MAEKISGAVSDRLYILMQEMAEYHNIPFSRVLELLLREGVQARSTRVRLEQMDAKLDTLIAKFGVDVEDDVDNRTKSVSGYPLTEGTMGADVLGKPHPFFQLTGSLDDDWEKTVDNYNFKGASRGKSD